MASMQLKAGPDSCWMDRSIVKWNISIHLKIVIYILVTGGGGGHTTLNLAIWIEDLSNLILEARNGHFTFPVCLYIYIVDLNFKEL